MRAPIGLRIRNYRKTKGLTQLALAKSIEISPSYLNLIEANKRDVGGTLLHKIAAKLDVDLHDLTGESETRLINELVEAFTDPIFSSQNLGIEDAHVLVAQLPKMARALHACFRGFLDASNSANALSNRLQSDPYFSQLLHQMLSQITAIRSTAEILRDIPNVSLEQKDQFYASIFDESHSLSDAAMSLAAQFDQEAEQHHSVTPAREVNDMIIGENNFFPALEQAAKETRAKLFPAGIVSEETLAEKLESLFFVSVRRGGKSSANEKSLDKHHQNVEWTETFFLPIGANAATRRFQLARQICILNCRPIIDQMCGDKRLTSDEARSQAFVAMSSYLAGALIFPYAQFLKQAQDSFYDVEFLAQLNGASFEQIAHRLVTLRQPDASGIPFGFLRADPSGFLSKQFPLPGLLMPNAGHACPLWALYASLRKPNEVVRQTVTFADGSRYLFIAKTSSKRVEAFNDQPVYSAIMLACDLVQADKTVYANGLQLGNSEFDTPVGPSCNLCVRRKCSHRHAPIASVSKR